MRARFSILVLALLIAGGHGILRAPLHATR